VHTDASGVSIRKTHSVYGHANEFTELDPLRSDAEMEDPYLYDPGYDGRGEGGPLYPGFGNITDPSSGCTQNGVYGLCDWGPQAVGIISTAFWGSRIADLPGFGTNWGSFADLGMWEYERRLEYTNARNGMARRTREGMPRGIGNLEYVPQNTTIDLNRVETLLKKPKCTNFLNGVLAELGKATGRGREGVAFEGLFNAARGSIFSVPAWHSRGSASPDGILIGNPSFKITILIRSDVPSDMESAPTTIMHEIIHSSAREGANYTHFEMARAAYIVGGAMGLLTEHDFPTPGAKPDPGYNSATSDDEKKAIDNHNSSLFQKILIQACDRH
jgi:hypothetical protein